MHPLEIFFTALALAMDAFAVSVASGMAARRFSTKHALTMGIWFGGFQALMPFLGWCSGVKLQNLISAFDHWVAFGLLLIIGCKMIYEAFKVEVIEKCEGPPGAYTMLVLAVATSIDAFAVGISFAMLRMFILGPIVVIGLVTFAGSAGGVWIGCRGVRFFEKKIEIAGGVILIGIGVKILVSHLTA